MMFSLIIVRYEYSAGLTKGDVIDSEAQAAIRLADWVAYLYRDSFDLARRDILRSELEWIEPFSRLLPTWRLCLPDRKKGLL